MFGLSDQALEAIKGCLQQYPEIAWAKIYGSRAKGNYERGSDIDLAFGSPRDCSAKLLEALDNLPTPYQFDVTHYESIHHEGLKAHIDRVGVTFYERVDQGATRKKGWQTKKLGDVCAFDKMQGIHHGLPYVGLEHIESHTARFIGSSQPQPVRSSTFRFSNQHVLYGRLRPYLNKALAPNFEGHCSTEIFPLKPRPELSREYLLFWLLADETCDRINATCTGARMPRANMNEVLRFDFPLPPLAEQRRIVGILDEAFAGIATAKANAEKNLQNARALFQSHLNSVFAQKGKGWVEKRLGDVTESISTGPFGTMLHKSDYVLNGIPLVNPMNIVNSKIVPSSKMMVNEETRDRLTTYVLKKGDIVIGRRGELGRCALVTDREVGWLCGTGSFLVRLSDTMDGEFFVALFGSHQFMARLEANAVGTTMSSLNHGILNDMVLPVPPIVDQKKIMARAKDLQAETQRLASIYQRKLAALDELKKSLLHQAFAGQL